MDGGIIVVSSPDGPMPQTKERILLARQVVFLCLTIARIVFLFFSSSVTQIAFVFQTCVYFFSLWLVANGKVSSI